MKARPILFNGDMVRAILDGRKTQTRRVIKHIAPLGEPDDWCGRYANDSSEAKAMLGDFRRFCPFGQPGDLLWVRETWMPVPATAYRQSAGVAQTVNPEAPSRAAIYRAGFDRSTGGIAWKPSIHMPRWASRLTLEITNVRVERLQDISYGGAKREGIDVVGGPASCAPYRNYMKGKPGEMDMHCASPIRSFQTLWDSIYSNWDANPWVWVVEFRAHQVNVDEFHEVAA